MKRLFCAVTLAAALCGCACKAETTRAESPVDYVSTLVGSQSVHAFSTGNTYPAVAVPWGMNFWTPQTGEIGNGWAYTYDAHLIRGFKQTHQPSPWINDYGQFCLMPVVGRDKLDQNTRASWFGHNAEVAKPFYYSVYLADHDVFAEMTATERAAVLRFTFPENEESAVVIDAFDRGSGVRMVDNRTIAGYSTRNSGGVPDNFRNYFVIRFSRPIEALELADFGQPYTAGSNILKPEGGKGVEGHHAVAKVYFSTRRGDKIEARVASSFISEAQAELNLREVGERPFEEVRDAAYDRWNDVLGRIEVGGGTVDQYRTFYSCLYRSLLFPRKFYEIDAEGKVVHYSPYNGTLCEGYMYTDTGFWDTFRCLFPLLNLVYPSVNAEIQEGLANAYRESGFLPEWASPGHRGCMVGNNSASVVADAIMKGITPEKDIETLYEALQHGTHAVHPKVSSTGRLGHRHYNKLGYVPYDVNVNENVARTLEYAYDDWCILQVAKKLGKEADIPELEKRAGNYRNVFDKSTNLMRGRNADGSFQEPFSPYKWGGAFTEGNAWHYTWSVFHDPQGLADLMGGDETFVQMLDSVFVVPPIYDASYYGGNRIHEITEMQVANMGNYAHGNQPAQHMIYLYGYAGQPWKAQYWVRQVMDRLYSAKPDGYCGDEDNGQTSAWYVFSALGFYPVCPASDEYIVGAPLFKEATIHLENGREVNISAPENSSENFYVKRMQFDGRDYTKNYLRYDELMRGADLIFEMAAKPDKKRATDEGDKPYSMSRE